MIVRSELPAWRYLVAVTRNYPTQCELYGIGLEEKLPSVNVPLASDDNDIELDLQAVFQRCWATGPYPELLHYDQPAPGELTGAEQQFCNQQLAQ